MPCACLCSHLNRESLDAYHALATLESRGAGNKTRFVAPPGGERAPTMAVLLEVATRMGLQLPTPQPMALDRLETVLGDMRPRAVFQVW